MYGEASSNGSSVFITYSFSLQCNALNPSEPSFPPAAIWYLPRKPSDFARLCTLYSTLCAHTRVQLFQQPSGIQLSCSILNNVCLKSYLKEVISSHKISRILFCCVLNVPKFLYFFGQMGTQKMQNLGWFHFQWNIWKKYTHIKLFAKNCCQAIIEVGKLAIFYTSLVKNF